MLEMTNIHEYRKLDEGVVKAIAEHEHMPDTVAADVGDHFLHSEGGVREICKMIVEDITAARREGNLVHIMELKVILARFMKLFTGAAHAPLG